MSKFSNEQRRRQMLQQGRDTLARTAHIGRREPSTEHFSDDPDIQELAANALAQPLLDPQEELVAKAMAQPLLTRNQQDRIWLEERDAKREREREREAKTIEVYIERRLKEERAEIRGEMVEMAQATVKTVEGISREIDRLHDIVRMPMAAADKHVEQTLRASRRRSAVSVADRATTTRFSIFRRCCCFR
jgi:hypothetical protein